MIQNETTKEQTRRLFRAGVSEVKLAMSDDHRVVFEPLSLGALWNVASRRVPSLPALLSATIPGTADSAGLVEALVEIIEANQK